jgi:carbon monoxide dehydrogenase subunit G
VKLTTNFSVPAPVPKAWEALLDLERVARLFPGATLEGGEGDEYRGSVRVKLGPMSVEYRGVARFTERDESSRRVVIEARGRETRGAGMANATVVTVLSPSGGGSAVSVDVDLAVSGRPAQLGAGVINDVAQRLVQEFSARLAADLTEPAPVGLSQEPGRPTEPEEPEVLNLGPILMRTVGRRALPILIGVALLGLGWVLGRACSGWRRSGGAGDDAEDWEGDS